MAKFLKDELQKAAKIMSRLAATPHKPHDGKKASAKTKKGRTAVRPKSGES